MFMFINYRIPLIIRSVSIELRNFEVAPKIAVLTSCASGLYQVTKKKTQYDTIRYCTLQNAI